MRGSSHVRGAAEPHDRPTLRLELGGTPVEDVPLHRNHAVGRNAVEGPERGRGMIIIE
jgi:hypothetical protein